MDKKIMNETSLRKDSRSLLILVSSLVILMFFSIFVGFLGILLGTTLKKTMNTKNEDITSVSTKCSNENGVWVENTKECEGVSEPFCRNLNGTFDACASPCRNKGGQVACIQMCLQVCTFK
ncbi:MAG: hypothetical protein ACMG57_04385 [Candidatus Dojkabacteria bacterium]